MAIVGHGTQPIVVGNIYGDSVASLLWITMSIDTHVFGSTAVAAMFYLFSVVQGVRSFADIIYPMIMFVHCPRYPDILLPIMYIDRQRCRSIVVDNGHGLQ